LLDEDTCECNFICSKECDYGHYLDRDVCECIRYIEEQTCDNTCTEPHVQNEDTCECECPMATVCMAAGTFFSAETCMCEQSTCEIQCPRRFSIDYAVCGCVCLTECLDPRKPVLNLDKCKCKRS